MPLLVTPEQLPRLVRPFSRVMRDSLPTPISGDQLRSEMLSRLEAVEEIVVADRNYTIDPTFPMWAGEETTTTAFIFVRAFNVKWPDLDEPVGYAEAQIGNLDYNTTYYVYFIDNDRDGTPDSCYFAARSRAELLQSPGVVIIGQITTPPAPGHPVLPQETSGGEATPPISNPDPPQPGEDSNPGLDPLYP